MVPSSLLCCAGARRLKGQLTDLKAKEATLVPHSAEYQANRIDYVKVKDTLKPLLEARKVRPPETHHTIMLLQ